MIIKLAIPDYSSKEGITLDWDDGFVISITTESDTVILKANQAGLTSLARHLLTLAQSEVPPGHHVHLDESNALEDSSQELILEKIA